MQDKLSNAQALFYIAMDAIDADTIAAIFRENLSEDKDVRQTVENALVDISNEVKNIDGLGGLIDNPITFIKTAMANANEIMKKFRAAWQKRLGSGVILKAVYEIVGSINEDVKKTNSTPIYVAWGACNDAEREDIAKALIDEKKILQVDMNKIKQALRSSINNGDSIAKKFLEAFQKSKNVPEKPAQAPQKSKEIKASVKKTASDKQKRAKKIFKKLSEANVDYKTLSEEGKESILRYINGENAKNLISVEGKKGKKKKPSPKSPESEPKTEGPTPEEPKAEPKEPAEGPEKPAPEPEKPMSEEEKALKSLLENAKQKIEDGDLTALDEIYSSELSSELPKNFKNLDEAKQVADFFQRHDVPVDLIKLIDLLLLKKLNDSEANKETEIAKEWLSLPETMNEIEVYEALVEKGFANSAKYYDKATKALEKSGGKEIQDGMLAAFTKHENSNTEKTTFSKAMLEEFNRLKAGKEFFKDKNAPEDLFTKEGVEFFENIGMPNFAEKLKTVVDWENTGSDEKVGTDVDTEFIYKYPNLREMREMLHDTNTKDDGKLWKLWKSDKEFVEPKKETDSQVKNFTNVVFPNLLTEELKAASIRKNAMKNQFDGIIQKSMFQRKAGSWRDAPESLSSIRAQYDLLVDKDKEFMTFLKLPAKAKGIVKQSMASLFNQLGKFTKGAKGLQGFIKSSEFPKLVKELKTGIMTILNYVGKATVPQILFKRMASSNGKLSNEALISLAKEIAKQHIENNGKQNWDAAFDLLEKNQFFELPSDLKNEIKKGLGKAKKDEKRIFTNVFNKLIQKKFNTPSIADELNKGMAKSSSINRKADEETDIPQNSPFAKLNKNIKAFFANPNKKRITDTIRNNLNLVLTKFFNFTPNPKKGLWSKNDKDIKDEDVQNAYVNLARLSRMQNPDVNDEKLKNQVENAYKFFLNLIEDKENSQTPYNQTVKDKFMQLLGDAKTKEELQKQVDAEAPVSEADSSGKTPATEKKEEPTTDETKPQPAETPAPKAEAMDAPAANDSQANNDQAAEAPAQTDSAPAKEEQKAQPETAPTNAPEAKQETIAPEEKPNNAEAPKAKEAPTEVKKQRSETKPEDLSALAESIGLSESALTQALYDSGDPTAFTAPANEEEKPVQKKDLPAKVELKGYEETEEFKIIRFKINDKDITIKLKDPNHILERDGFSAPIIHQIAGKYVLQVKEALKKAGKEIPEEWLNALRNNLMPKIWETINNNIGDVLPDKLIDQKLGDQKDVGAWNKHLNKENTKVEEKYYDEKEVKEFALKTNTSAYNDYAFNPVNVFKNNKEDFIEVENTLDGLLKNAWGKFGDFKFEF